MALWEIDAAYDPAGRPGQATVVPVHPKFTGAGTDALHPLTILLRAAGAINDGFSALAPRPAPADPRGFRFPDSVPIPGPSADVARPPVASPDPFTPPGPMGMDTPLPAPPAAPAPPPPGPPVMTGPSADVDRPVVAPPVNSDLFGRFLRVVMDANPILDAIPPEQKDRALSIFRLWADQAWRENSMAGTVVSNLESGVHETPEALRRLPAGSVGPHNLMMRKPIGQQSNYMDARPPEVQQNLAERAERKQISYAQGQAEKRDQMRSLGPLSTGDQIGAIISSLFGSLLSPETAVGPGGVAYSTARTGSKSAQSALINAGVVGLTDPIAQTEAVARGDKREYSPTEHALATGGAAALGALIPALGALARRFGALREAPRGEAPSVAPPEAPRGEAPPVRPAEPNAKPDLRYTEEGVPIIRITPEKKAEAAPPAKPDPAVEGLKKLTGESLERVREKAGVPAEAPKAPEAPPKPATEPAIPEAPRAVEAAPKLADGPFNRGVAAPETPPKADVPAVVETPKGERVRVTYQDGTVAEATKIGETKTHYQLRLDNGHEFKPLKKLVRVEPVEPPAPRPEPARAPEPSPKSVDKVDAPRESAGMQQATVEAPARPASPTLDPGGPPLGYRGAMDEGKAAGAIGTPADANPYRRKISEEMQANREPHERLYEYARDWDSGHVAGRTNPVKAAEQPPDIPDFLRRPMPEKAPEPVREPSTTPAPEPVRETPRTNTPQIETPQTARASEPPPKPTAEPARVEGEKPRIEVGKERSTNGRPEIEYRGPFGKNGEDAPVMNASYVVTAERGARAGDKSWVVERRYYDYSGNNKYGGRQVWERLTPGITKREARDFALRASQEELDSAGRADFKPTKYTSREYVQPGDPVLVKNGETWQLGRALETDIHGRVMRAEVGGKQVEVQRGESARFSEELRPGYETLMKRHGEKTWATPQDAKQSLIKWRNKTLADAPKSPAQSLENRDVPSAKSESADSTRPRPQTGDETVEFHASLGLTPAMAKAMGPELVTGATTGVVGYWEENGRFGFSPKHALAGALAMAALRHRLPFLSKPLVGKTSYATDALKAGGDALASTKAGRWFHPTMGIEQDLWDKLLKVKVETRNFQDDALKIAKYIRENTTVDERILISDWIERRDLGAHGINSWQQANAKVQGMADALSQHVDQIGAALEKVGMLDPAARAALQGEYLHRYYLPKLAADDGFKQKAARMKASGSYALRRGETVGGADAGAFRSGDTAVQWTHAHNGTVEYHPPGHTPGADWFSSKEWKVERANQGKMDLHRDYTPQERTRMGEIRDANFRFAMGSMEASRDLALGTMFKDLASSPRWSSASDPGGWVKVPTTSVGEGSAIKKYGLLAGRYVSPETWDALKIVHKPWSPEELGAMGGVMNGYLKAMGVWKVGKTAYNPATHFNNVMGNMSLSMLTGEVGPTHLMKAIGAMRRSDPVIEEARRAGLSLNREANLGDTFDGVRVDVGLASGLDPRTGWTKFMDWYTNNAIVRAYQHEDSVFKLGAYMRRRAAGESPEEAVKNVHQVFFDYSDVPLGVQFTRDFYSPFITYTYKYGQVMMREMAERPHRYIAAFGMLSALDMMSYDWLYGDRAKAVSDYEREMAPKWLQGRSGFGAQKAIRMPWNERDSQTGENRALMLNTRYLIPGGDILDWVANGNFGPSIYPQALGNTILGGNPLLNFAFGLATGKDTFFNKPLYPYPDTGLMDFGKRPASEIAANWGAAARFAASQALPPTLLATPDKLGQAAVGEGAIAKGGPVAEFFGWTGTDFAGRQKSIARAIGSSLGVKIEDVAPDEAMKFRQSELAKEVRGSMTNTRNLHGNQSTTETRKENAVGSTMDRVERFRKETSKMRDLQDKAGPR